MLNGRFSIPAIPEFTCWRRLNRQAPSKQLRMQYVIRLSHDSLIVPLHAIAEVPARMSNIAVSLLLFSALALLLHVATAVVVGVRLHRARHMRPPRDGWPEVSIIRPVSGLDEIETRTLESTFRLHATNVEIIFCAERESDPAIPFLQKLAAAHSLHNVRILIGTDLGSLNPKLNNIYKGWKTATKDWGIITDSNVLLPPDYVARVLSSWSDDAGLVCAPPIGSEPAGFWAEVECAFLNTYQGRWQYAADVAGFGFAQGKTMVWRRCDLNAWGGIAALAGEIAEDAAATKLVRSKGKRVRLSAVPFPQPIGRRTASQVLRRQERWAQLRRLSFPQFFVPELLTGFIVPLAAGCAGLMLLDTSTAPLLISFGAGFLLVWLAAEAALARLAGWPLSVRSPFAWMIRDALIPYVWAKAWVARGYEWRGNSVALIAKKPASSHQPITIHP